MKKLTALIIVIMLFAGSGMVYSQVLNKKLQSLQLKDLNGKNIDLLSVADTGKICIISIWATWCPPCIKEITNMNNVLEEWQTKYNIKLIAISIDDARNSQKVKNFVNGKGWTFDVLLDPNGDTKRAFNFTNPPYCILIDKSGNIVFTHLGYVEGDENILEKEIQKLVTH